MTGKIADTANAIEKRLLCERKTVLVARHDANREVAIRAEDAGRMYDYKLEAHTRHQRHEDLAKDKKKLFFTIWANREVSLQKTKEHLTVAVRLEFELNSQDPLILCNAIKATYTSVK